MYVWCCCCCCVVVIGLLFLAVVMNFKTHGWMLVKYADPVKTELILYPYNTCLKYNVPKKCIEAIIKIFYLKYFLLIIITPYFYSQLFNINLLSN